MPVTYLTADQRKIYGRYAEPPSENDLARFFYLSDEDHALINRRRGNHNKLGFALQLVTVRYLGLFLEDPLDIPDSVLNLMAKQLAITDFKWIHIYRTGEQRWAHALEIRTKYGYQDINDGSIGLRLVRWLYGLCWTGTERPSVLFDRSKGWLLSHKIILPGITVLERLIARVRSRVEDRLNFMLGKCVTEQQRKQLENLLTVPDGSRRSLLDELRLGPVRVSSPSLVSALLRLQSIRNLGISIQFVSHIPQSRLTSMARFAATASVWDIARLPPDRRLAILVAFIHCLEAKAHDDALDLLDLLLQNLFNRAMIEDKKKRLRSIKDLDQAATTLAKACQILLEIKAADIDLQSKVFEKVPRETLEKATKTVNALVRPPDDVYFLELNARYNSVRHFLPALLKRIRFESNLAGKPVVDAFNWLRDNEDYAKNIRNAPREVIRKSWQRYVVGDDEKLDHRAYVFCVLNELHKALKRRDVFVSPSWRYSDPRFGLISGVEWESTRPVICRTLGLSTDPQPVLAALTEELDQTYRMVSARLPSNSFVRFKTINGKSELILSPLDKLEEPSSLVTLRKLVSERLPRVDLPEILLEIATRVKFTDFFVHITERASRAEELTTSLCAVLLAEACNTGIEPLIRNDIKSLKRDRLLWVNQNYVRNDTLCDVNAQLVAAQNQIPLANLWGGGEVASADGMRFVVPIRTVHSGPNPKYFGRERGVTWYNLISNQFSGLNAITVPGTLRDSLVLLAVVLDQQTELQPTQIMTDTGAYSDIVFWLFRLLGYRFSPRLADVGGTRFWRIDPKADYGELNTIARQQINMKKIAEPWDDLLRLAGSLKLGCVPATGIMRILQIGDRPTRLAQGLAEFGRIEKTLHILNDINDENRRRTKLCQLNRGEGRHSLARVVFHGKRGELYQRYKEGQEDQLGALGLVVNIIVLWNTIYMDAILNQLRQEGLQINDEDAARLSPLIYEHINMLGRYSFAIPDSVSRGELRPLRNPAIEDS